jgi:hypothetical protein
MTTEEELPSALRHYPRATHVAPKPAKTLAFQQHLPSSRPPVAGGAAGKVCVVGCDGGTILVWLIVNPVVRTLHLHIKSSGGFGIALVDGALRCACSPAGGRRRPHGKVHWLPYAPGRWSVLPLIFWLPPALWCRWWSMGSPGSALYVV